MLNQVVSKSLTRPAASRCMKNSHIDLSHDTEFAQLDVHNPERREQEPAAARRNPRTW